MAPPFEDNTRKLLDSATRYFFDFGEPISGKRLRKECAMERSTFDAAFASLAPFYMRQAGERHDDRYWPTLRGALESQYAERIIKLLSSVLKHLAQEFELDPDVKIYKWSGMRASDSTLSDADYRWVVSIIRHTNLKKSTLAWGENDFIFSVPDDIEEVIKIDAAKLLAVRIEGIEINEIPELPEQKPPLPEALLSKSLVKAENIIQPEPPIDVEPIPQSIEGDDTSTLELVEPFDPAKIRIETKVMTVDLLLKRLKEEEIDLMPDFQREGGLWKDREQSRLIESLLVRIPIPAFYMDATNEDRWLVVDGLQRLTVFKRFIVDGTLELSQLEFLQHFEGMRFQDLPRPMQRRIEETQVTVSLIQPGTPEDVRYYIFKRINTGGLPLTPQEIRHALNQGPASVLIADLAHSEDFIKATGGSMQSQRMADRECVLRFFAFRLTRPDQYHSQDLDGFLNGAMRQMNKMTAVELEELSRSFRRAMNAAHAILGRYAFRKRTLESNRINPINKALFETWAVNLSLRSDDELARLVERREQVNDASMLLLMKDREFDLSVTQSTGDAKRVRIRFERVAELLRGVLQ